MNIKSWRVVNVILIGFTFLFVFISFDTTENFLTTTHGTKGTIALGIIFFSYGFAVPFVPLLVMIYSMIIGVICILPFVVFNMIGNDLLIILSAIIVGIGMGIVWCSKGSITTRCSLPEDRGRNSGIFYFLYQINQTIGNGIAMIFIMYEVDMWILYLVLTIIMIISIIFIIPIQQDVFLPKESFDFIDNIKSIIHTLKTPQMLLLLPIFCYSGISQAYIYGEMTQMFGVNNVSLAMVIFGTTNMCGSLLFGKLSDIIGRISVIGFSVIFMIVAMILVTIHYWLELESFIILYFVAFFVGLSDGTMNIMLDSMLGRYFPNTCDVAFSGFYSIQSFASGFAFLLYIIVSYYLTNEFVWHLFESLLNVTSLLIGITYLVVLNQRSKINIVQ
ncbi:UNC93-like protein MFSD11 [Entamoeba marina]